MKRTKQDKSFSDAKRAAEDWTCEICGKVSPPDVDNGMMDCSHDRSRRHPFTRYHPDNVICSCRACHMKSTEDHDFHVQQFDHIKGATIRAYMNMMSNRPHKLKKWEMEAIHKHYLAEQKRIKGEREKGYKGPIELLVPECLK